MTPAAAERLRVYQEGQRCARIFNPPCPYKWSDWRSATWHKGLMEARKYNKRVAGTVEQSATPLPEPASCATCGEGPYFTAQQMREYAAALEQNETGTWSGLTEAEIDHFCRHYGRDARDIASAVEEMLKEKNT